MKKKTIYLVLLCLILLFSINIAYASYSNLGSLVMSLLLEKNFGGTITDTKARDIKQREEENYSCKVEGSSIEIDPQKKSFPSSYYIPPDVTSKSKNQLMNKQTIIGKYNPTEETTITCTKTPPPSEKTVTLDTIKIYSNSKK